MALFRTILILALIYFGVRFLTRLLFPWLLKTFVRKVEKRVNEQMNKAQDSTEFEQAGEIYIKRSKTQKSKSSKNYDGGEYVDFEEIEDDN